MRKRTYEITKDLIIALLLNLFLFYFFKMILFDYGSLEFKNLITNFSFTALKDFLKVNKLLIILCSSYFIIPVFNSWITIIRNYLINILKTKDE